MVILEFMVVVVKVIVVVVIVVVVEVVVVVVVEVVVVVLIVEQCFSPDTQDFFGIQTMLMRKHISLLRGPTR